MKNIFIIFTHLLGVAIGQDDTCEIVDCRYLSSQLYQTLKQEVLNEQPFLNLANVTLLDEAASIVGASIQDRPYLTQLCLNQCGLKDNSSQPILASLIGHQKLEYLDLSLNNLGQESLKTLALIAETAPNLKYIDLHINSFLGTALGDLFAGLQTTNQIRHLDIGVNILNTQSTRALSTFIQTCTSIKKLLMSSMVIPLDERQNFLQSLGQNSCLSRIELSYNNFSGLGAQIGQAIKLCKPLGHIDLVWCQLTSSDYYYLFQEVYANTLQKPKKRFSFSSSRRNIRGITIHLEDTAETQAMLKFHDSIKSDQSDIQLFFQLGPRWG